MIIEALASLRASSDLSRHDFIRSCATVALAMLFGLASVKFGAFLRLSVFV